MNVWKALAGIAVLALLVQVGLMATVLFAGRTSPQFFGGPEGQMWGYHGQMMAGYGGMMGYGPMGPGMMGSRTGPFSNTTPLSVEDTWAAAEGYLARLGDPDLAVKEVMVFTNHAYAQVVEKSTGISAFEVLVDPVTRAVTPEPGPNMMWNLKYGHMAGPGGFGMMMGPYGGSGTGRMMEEFTPPRPPADMPVSPQEAIQAVQRYLDAYLPGARAGDEADPFYGYYTIHIMRGSKTVGMVSVNGYTLEVFPHFWHGQFVAMGEEDPA
jgi:hypothetical protein